MSIKSTSLIFCIVLLALTAGAWNATLVNGAGGPQIAIDGKPVPPRMFWGVNGVSHGNLTPKWSRFEMPFKPLADSDRITFHFRFDKHTPGARVQLRHFRVTQNGQPISADFTDCFTSTGNFQKAWHCYPPDYEFCSYAFASNDTCTVTLNPHPTPNDPDWHFYTKFFSLRKGVSYRLEFEARGDNVRWLMPGIYDVDAKGKHNVITPVNGDTLTSTAQKAAAAGVDFVSYETGSAWGENGDDFTRIDDITQKLIDANPNVRLVPRVTINAPRWWLEKHPEHRMQYAAEHAGITGRHIWGKGLRPDMAAVSSRLYQREAIAYVTRVAGHFMQRFPRNFAGIHPTGQNTCEWFYYDSWSKMNGYDPQTLAAFRDYLHDPAATVPTCAERLTNADHQHLLDPVVQKRCIEFNRFQQLEMTDFVAQVARACRKATGGTKLVLFFYGYAWEFSAHNLGPANSGHYGLENLIRKADGCIDVLCSPISYHDRAWCGSAPNMSAGETVMRNGILWLNEDDSRTHLDHRREKNVQEGTLVNLEQTQQVLRRNTAQEAIRGFGSWWMDLPGWGWYDCKELWDVQKELMPFESTVLNRRARFTPEIALIQDEESMINVAPRAARINRPCVQLPREQVNRCGAPHGQYLLYDVCEKPLSAKLQIFQSCWCISDTRFRQLLKQKSEHPAVRVWCWAAGLRDEHGHEDLARMSKLTGFAFRQVKDTAGYNHYLVTDARDEEILARLPNGTPNIVARTRNGSTDVFVSYPELTAQDFHKLAKLAGVHTYLSEGDVGKATLWAANDLANGATGLSLQAMADCELHLAFPRTGTIRDAITGAILAQGSTVTLKLKQGDSRVLLSE